MGCSTPVVVHNTMDCDHSWVTCNLLVEIAVHGVDHRPNRKTVVDRIGRNFERCDGGSVITAHFEKGELGNRSY